MKFIARLTRRFRQREIEAKEAASAQEQEVRRIIAAGNEARNLGRWDIAIDHYAKALVFAPDNAAVRVQMGHGLKELGRLPEAEAAYRAGVAARPGDADFLLQLGHVLKLQGRHEEALAAYSDSVRLDPQFEAARTELIAAGGRSLLPDALYGRSAMTDALTRLSSALRAEKQALRDIVEVSTFPVEAYDAFRQTFPIQPPHGRRALDHPVVVLIDATDAPPGSLRLTLTSLIDQSVGDWIAVVRNAGANEGHPVASLAAQDARIRFADSGADPVPRSVDAKGPLLLCDAGVALDPEALAWFSMALARTGADFVYADHDHHTHHWRRGRTYVDPVFQAMADPWDARRTPALPAALLIQSPWRKDLTSVKADAGETLRRRLLVAGLEAGRRAAHVPRVLASVRVLSLDGDLRPKTPPSPPSASVADDRLIRVIIPTRDEPEILKACVDSLFSHAARPELLRIQILDNRSAKPETAALLDAFKADARITVQAFDEPFNWARINNVAAADGPKGSILVFANNDVEMLTQDWDERLRATLADPKVGLIGVRLLYPDRLVQHAGVMLGVNDQRPVHEGLARSDQEPGPNGRWLRAHQSAAVTGAFMAMDQAVFERLGGFNERLAVGYNDIDLCLKVRAENLAVLYEPSIELIHYESKTRGRADEAKVSWDDEELTDLHARWGRWMMFDPGKNPQWFSTHERPYDGLRNPTQSEILSHIDMSARERPWSIDRDSDFAGSDPG